jgi:hypothetical protein
MSSETQGTNLTQSIEEIASAQAQVLTKKK